MSKKPSPQPNRPARSFFPRLILAILLIEGLALLLGYRRQDLLYHFDERKLITWVSALQLLAVAIMTWRLFLLRRRQLQAAASPCKPALIWALIGSGFSYLVLDEYFLLHEKLDGLIHTLFHLQETGLTDRFDDGIVGLYGLLALALL